MSVARYIELCALIKDTPDGPEYDLLLSKLDAEYKALSADEIAAVNAHFEAQEPG